MKHTPDTNFTRGSAFGILRNAFSILLVSVTLVILASFAVTSAFAQTNDSVSSGEWTDTATWTSGTVPTLTDGLETDLNQGHVVTVTSGTAGAASSIDVANGPGTGATLTIQGGTLIVGGTSLNSRIGAASGDTGIFNITSGLAQFQGGRDLLVAAAGVSPVGLVDISGGTLEIDGDLQLASDADGLASMNFSGGAVLVGRDGFNAGAASTGANLFVGTNGTGILNVSGGQLNILRQVLIGQNNGGVGSVLITGGALTNVNTGQGVDIDRNDSIFVGNSGFGEVTINGGTLRSDGSVLIGDNSNQNGGTNLTSGTGILNLIDGVLKGASNDGFEGGDSNGNITAGSLAHRNNAGATASRGVGYLNQSGGLATANQILIGQQGDGYLNMSGGTQGTQGNYIFGSGTTIATINSGGGTVRVSGTGYGVVSGGVINIDDGLLLGSVQDSYGSLLVTGGLIQASLNTANTDHLTIGGNGGVGDTDIQGYLTVDGGTVINNPDQVGVTGPNQDDADIMVGWAEQGGTLSYGELKINSGRVDSARHVRVAINSFNQGRLEVNGGVLNVDDYIFVGDGNGSVASFLLTGGTINTNLGGSGGDSGDGRFRLADGQFSQALGTITGGVLNAAGIMEIAVNADALGTLWMSGGVINQGGGDDGLGGGGNQDFNVGTNGLGAINLSGGTINAVDAGRSLSFGQNNAGTGRLNITGGVINSNGNVIFGNNGLGSLNMSGGVIDTTGVDGDGNSIAFGNNTGTGLGVITGGLLTYNNNDDFRIGVRANAIGSVLLAGGTIRGGELNVAEGSPVEAVDDTGALTPAKGVLEVQGGVIDINGSIFVGRQDDSRGTYIQSGGFVTSNNDFILGELGSTEFHVEQGGNQDTRFGAVFGAAEGTAVITGGTLAIGDNSATDSIIIGQRGNGTMTIGGNAVVSTTSNLTLGAIQDGQGTDTTGAGTGRGFLTIEGNANVTVGVGTSNPGNFWIAGNSGNANADQYTVGSVNITGGVTTVLGDVNIALGNNRTGTLVQSGGTLSVDSRLLVGSGSNTAGTRAVASYELTGGLLELGTSGGGAGTLEDDNHPDATINLSGGKARAKAVGGNFYRIRSAGTNASIVLARGTAIVDLRGGNLLTNDTVGEFQLDDSSSLVNVDSIGEDVTQGAADQGVNLTLNGSSTLDINNGNGEGPTDNILDLHGAGGTALGSLDANGTSIINLAILADPNAGGAGVGVRGTHHEGIIAGGFDFAAGVTINVDEGSAGLGLTLDAGDEFDLLGLFDFFGGTEAGGGTITGAGGTFGMLPTLSGGLLWDTTTRWTSEGVIFVGIIPEPSRALLLVIGLAAATMRRRRGGLI